MIFQSCSRQKPEERWSRPDQTVPTIGVQNEKKRRGVEAHTHMMSTCTAMAQGVIHMAAATSNIRTRVMEQATYFRTKGKGRPFARVNNDER